MHHSGVNDSEYKRSFSERINLNELKEKLENHNFVSLPWTIA